MSPKGGLSSPMNNPHKTPNVHTTAGEADMSTGPKGHVDGITPDIVSSPQNVQGAMRPESASRSARRSRVGSSEDFLRKAIWILLLGIALGVCAVPASAQNNRAFGYCELGGQQAVVSGLQVSPDIQASYPGCSVTVYLTGTLTLATIYSDKYNTPKGNPFTADTTTGYWFFMRLPGDTMSPCREGLQHRDSLLRSPSETTLSES